MMDFSGFVKKFYISRGKTVIRGITNQAGIVRFFLCDICSGDELLFSDDYYRMLFTGKRFLMDEYWWEIENCLSADAEKILSERLSDKYLYTLIKRFGQMKTIDKNYLSDVIIQEYLSLVKGGGETSTDQNEVKSISL